MLTNGAAVVQKAGGRVPGAKSETENGVVARDVDQPIRAAVAAGDLRQGLALCARVHGATVGRLCMSMLGSQAEAEQITEQTLLEAHDAFSSKPLEPSIRGWLLGTARRHCARRLERPSARLVRAPEETRERGEGGLAIPSRAAQVRSVLGRLRPSERDALLLRYSAGLCPGHVAEACGIDRAAVERRLADGVLALREALKEE